ncbi:hypothetical protein OC834_007985, partial [Tilletia horrida]
SWSKAIYGSTTPHTPCCRTRTASSTAWLLGVARPRGCTPPLPWLTNARLAPLLLMRRRLS